MGTTNILDLNNRVDEIEKSYPAEQVMMSDGTTSVEDAVVKISDDVVKQAAGTSITINARYILIHNSVNYEGYVLFPFIAHNANYTVHITNAIQDNVGDVLGSIEVIDRNYAGFRFTIPGVYAYTNCGISITYTITFA